MQAFARPAFRAASAGTLRRFPRAGIRYQSTAPPKDRTNSTLIYSGIATLAVVGGYWYVRQGSSAVTNDTQAGKEPEKAFAGGEQGFLSLKLDSTEDINHNTKKFIFQLPKSDMIAGLPVASALSTQYKTEEMEKAVSRPYTPTSAEDERGYLELIVKKYQDGPMSSHIHSLKPGDSLDIKGPIVKYDYQANMHNHIAMIAGGSGITPMYQVARRILSDPDDKTKVTLVFGNVTKEDILLKKEFDKFENTYPNRFRAFYVLDNPPEDWQGGKGFITRDLLKTVLPEPKEENIKIFVCGPPGLYKAVSGTKAGMKDQGELTGALKELGYAKDQVFKF